MADADSTLRGKSPANLRGSDGGGGYCVECHGALVVDSLGIGWDHVEPVKSGEEHHAFPLCGKYTNYPHDDGICELPLWHEGRCV